MQEHHSLSNPPASPGSLQAACTASLAASLLLLLKHNLIAAYGLTVDRITAYHPAEPDKRKTEEQRTVQRRPAKLGFHVLRLDAASDASLIAEQAKVGLARSEHMAQHATWCTLCLCHCYFEVCSRPRTLSHCLVPFMNTD